MPDTVDVLSLGEAMVELSAREPVSLREARTFDLGWGGDTSNVAVAVSRLGGSAGYVTKVGDDAFGASLRDLWAREGVGTDNVIVDESRPTGVYFLSRQAAGPHAFTYYRSGSAASTLQPRDLASDLLSGVRVLHTSGISQAIGPGPCDAAFTALHAARSAGVVTSYDPNLRLALWSLDRARAVIMAAVSMVDIVLPSLEDARALTGLDEPAAIAEEFLARGSRVVALKLGADGALVADENGREIVPPYQVQAVDPAGAGDTFDAAFLTAWLAGEGLAGCADFANAAAALTATGVGCVSPIPQRSDVDLLRLEQQDRQRSGTH